MAEIQDLIRKMTKSKEEIYSCVCTVVEIDEEKRYIKAKPSNGSAEIFDVRLQTVVSGALGLVYFPKLDSEVIISYISKELAYVALFSEIEKVKLDIGKFSLFVDASNVNLKVENIEINNSVTNLNVETLNLAGSETNIDTDELNIEAETVKTVTTGSFEVEGGTQIVISAPEVVIEGITAIFGDTTIDGQIVLNGGSNGGIPKALTISQELNKLIDDFRDLKAKFNAWTVTGTVTDAAALKAQLAGWTPNVTDTTPAGISNGQVTH